MPSLIPDYEYDIFISYRHKDNKYDGWVSEFVANLRKELEATFKEDVSIYFDENPHDGLLETHHVDKSLEGKLKCLIFIPIISQTYCDPKSFAWQYEFLAFNKMVKEDQFGREVTLSNGNVASRILPIKIHDLDAADRALLENSLGGVLRSIDFIFKSPGVNRPLSAHEEHSHDNLNKTFYRDQINKVSNAIKEIIVSIRNEGTLLNVENLRPSRSAPTRLIKSRNKILFSWIGIMLILLLIYFYYQNQKGGTRIVEVIDKSIAVLPFTDISENHDQAYFSDGMMIEIMDHLFKIDSLRIIPRNSTVSYKDSSKPIKEIAKELGVFNLITGSVRKSDGRVKISVQLIRGEDEHYIWQQTYEREIADVFSVQSDVAQQIASALKAQITPEVKLRIEAIPTPDQQAYEFFLKGRSESKKVWSNLGSDHAKRGIEYLNKAIALDNKFSNAYTALGEAYWLLAHYHPDYTTDYWKKSKENLNRAIALDPLNGWAYSELAVVQHNWDWNKMAALKSLKKAVQLNPSDIEIHFDFLWFYLKTDNCDSVSLELNAIKSIEPGYYFGEEVFLKICNNKIDELAALKVPDDPYGVWLWAAVERYLILRQFDKALLLIDQKKEAFGEVFFLAIKGEALALSGETNEARAIIQKLEALSKTKHIWPSYFAIIYMGLGEEKKAYEYLEHAVEERDLMLHTLPYTATFYIKKDDPKFIAFMKRTWIP